MAQDKFKIIQRFSEDLDSILKGDFEFYDQNETNYRICRYNSKTQEYILITTSSKYVLLTNDESFAKDILYSDNTVYLGGILETEEQGEIERITPENINEKSEEFLLRFNKNFKLNVDYYPKEMEIDSINKSVKNTKWNKENLFLMNFYMMEVCKRRYNYQWQFRKVNTFNSFYEVEVLENDGPSTINFYSFFNIKSMYDFNKYIEFHKRFTVNLDGSISIEKIR